MFGEEAAPARTVRGTAGDGSARAAAERGIAAMRSGGRRNDATGVTFARIAIGDGGATATDRPVDDA